MTARSWAFRPRQDPPVTSGTRLHAFRLLEPERRTAGQGGQFAKGGGRVPGRTVPVKNIMGHVDQVPEEFVSGTLDDPQVDYNGWSKQIKAEKQVVTDALVAAQPPLDGAQARSLGAYQSAFGVHQEINRDLRDGKTDGLHVKELDSIMADSSLPIDVSLYRGRQFANAKELKAHMAGVVPGAVLTDRGYVSTSTNEGTAGMFTGYGTRPAVVYKINAAAGSTGYRYLSGSEDEVLLPRGTTFRVTSVKSGLSQSKYDVWEVEGELVSSG